MRLFVVLVRNEIICRAENLVRVAAAIDPIRLPVTTPITIVATRKEEKPSQVSPSALPDSLIALVGITVLTALAGLALLRKTRS